MVHFSKFLENLKLWGQTVLPDRSILIGQKLVENVKIVKFKWDHLSNFEKIWIGIFLELLNHACENELLRCKCLTVFKRLMIR